MTGFQNIASEILSFTGNANVLLVISIFIVLAISEFGVSIPYLMETVWILIGYHALNGSLSFYYVLILWVAAMGGRTMGAIILYHIARFGGNGIMKIYRRIFGSALPLKEGLNNRLSQSNSLPVRVLRKINELSPYSVAFGRLIWLRVPITLTLGIRRQIKILVPGVVISSAIWDTTYILVGVVGGDVQLQPFQIVLFSLCALTVIYSISFLIRWIIKYGEARQYHKIGS
jgi:membrane-associated protein